MADDQPISPEKAAELFQIIKPLEGMITNASAILLQWAGNDAVVVFQRPHPARLPNGEMAPVALQDTVAQIHMSSATLKDFQVLLTLQMEKYEKENGTIETAYTRRLAAQSKN